MFDNSNINYTIAPAKQGFKKKQEEIQKEREKVAKKRELKKKNFKSEKI